MYTLLLALIAVQARPSDSFGELRQQWARDLHEKHVEASVALYAPEAVFIQPDGARVEGTRAIRELFEKVTSTFDSSLEFSSQAVETSGDLTYDSGSYTETLITRATGKALRMKGSYLTVYRRGKNGNWKIVQQMWSAAANQGQSR